MEVYRRDTEGPGPGPTGGPRVGRRGPAGGPLHRSHVDEDEVAPAGRARVVSGDIPGREVHTEDVEAVLRRVVGPVRAAVPRVPAPVLPLGPGRPVPSRVSPVEGRAPVLALRLPEGDTLDAAEEAVPTERLYGVLRRVTSLTLVLESEPVEGWPFATEPCRVVGPEAPRRAPRGSRVGSGDRVGFSHQSTALKTGHDNGSGGLHSGDSLSETRGEDPDRRG